MKRNYLLGLGLSLLLFACEDESLEKNIADETNNQEIKASSINDYVSFDNEKIKFASFDAWDNFLSEKTEDEKEEIISTLEKKFSNSFNAKKAKSTSIFARSLSDSTENFLQESILGDLLNEDGVVQIGEYLFKVNLDKQRVLAIHESDQAGYKALVEEDITNPLLLVYSTEDDVLLMLEEEIYKKSSSARMSGLFCREDGAPERKAKQDEVYMVYENYRYRLDAKHGYQKAGIYFSLMTEFKHMRKHVDSGDLVTWSQHPTKISLTYTYKYKAKCRSSVGYLSYYANEDYNNKLSRRVYESGRGLHAFYLDSDYQWEGPDGGLSNLEWLGSSPIGYRY